MSKITPENLDKWLFNYHEGNLTSSEQKALEQFLQTHPEYEVDEDAWNNTRLNDEPLVPVIFENELHAIAGESFFVTYRNWFAAASLLLLFGGSALYFLFSIDENTTENETVFSQIEKGFPAENKLFTENSGNRNHTSNNSSLNSASFNQSSSEENGTNTLNGNSTFITNKIEFLAQQINRHNESKNKKRETVIINIKNDVVFTVEKSYVTVTENNFASENPELTANNEKAYEIAEVTDGPDERVKLSLKENNYNRRISEYAGTKNNRRKNYRYDPNPALTNLRDPQLLLPDNHLTNVYGGFAGGMIASRFSVNYRNNWTGNNEVSSQQGFFTYDKLMRKLKTGIAFTAFYNDYNKNSFATAGAALTLSPKFKIGRGMSIEPAVTFSYSQKTLGDNTLTPGTYIENNRGNVIELYGNGNIPVSSVAYMPDMKLGTVFQSKKMWAAVSVDHLLMQKEKLYSSDGSIKNKPEFKATVGTDYLHRPETGNVFSPQLSLYRHNGYTEMWLGMLSRFKQFSVGGSFSQYKDFMATIGFQTHSLKMFYQYDMTRSMLMNEKIGSHEIGLRFSLSNGGRSSKSILNNER